MHVVRKTATDFCLAIKLDEMNMLQGWSRPCCGQKILCHDRWRLVPASVALVTETQCTPTGMVYRRSRGSIPGSAGRFLVWIPGTRALRLISGAGKESATVSSIIGDRWLILS